MKRQMRIYKPSSGSRELNMQIPRKMSSAQTVMASITRTLATRNDPHGKASNEVKLAGEESKDKLYEPKHRKKVFRVMTVIAYIILVSSAAIILSLFYVFIWNPTDYRLLIRRAKLNNSTKLAECLNSASPGTLDELALRVHELNEDKTSSNGTEFMNKLKSMYTTSNDKENLQDPIRVETTVELTSTTDSLISIVQEETSKSYDADIDKSVLPER
ncbi:hypothetical protein KQX54_020454 [Cotesia glomerata]|uniref:Uncharacterized protein n=1 Tax=Cotesia glomerata TaxID=32391 RepID=A0AAV7J9M4_COTGL|nr:hypothetical protein KQX54_020454 [Cotesia glomerata]